MSDFPDKEYWRIELPVPYSPSSLDVKIYKQYLLHGSVLLLGCTHKLINLSTNIMDIDPWYSDDPRVIVSDWRDNTCIYDNMIGDGVLNFNKSLCNDILNMASSCCERLIIRCFNHKLDKMVIADYFPSANDLAIEPSIKIERKDYNFYVWKFK